MWDVIIDTLMDAVKLLPFLFAAYLAMEYIEHKMGEKAKRSMEKAGKSGPAWGGIIGAFPQCGFSAAAANLYAGRVITLGTLLAVFLSTSDEMLPILISEKMSIVIICQLLGLKILVGTAAGFLTDLLVRKNVKGKHFHKGEKHSEYGEIGHICEHENCHCEEGIVKSAFRHTVNIFLFLFLITFLLNMGVHYIGEDFLANLILNRPLLGHMIAGLIGLIPNCASSVILTRLYLDNVVGLGVMMSGLLAGSGVGLAVLFRINDNGRENIKIALLLYVIGVAAGILIDLLGITTFFSKGFII